VIDDGVALFFKGPHSYTGENGAEITLHGSPVVLDLAVSLITAQGARPADRGEFTRRAFLSGRLDLIQAESVIDLIEAASPLAARYARAGLNKSVSEQVHALRDQVADILADLVAFVDFDEDDELVPPDPRAGLLRISNSIESLRRRSAATRTAREGILAVIVGKPNVGKSTLFNALIESDRAIVTPYPGTTRDTLHESLSLEGGHYVLCDTAGLREAAEPIEEEGVRRTYGKLREADVVIAVCDGSADLDAEDATVLHACRDRPGVIVVNKADLPPAFSPGTAFKEAPHTRVVSVSALEGIGLDALRQELASLGQALVPGLRDPERSAGLSSRAVHLLEAAAVPVQRLLDAYEAAAPLPWDAMIIELESTMNLLGHITGETADEETLDRVFSRFCVGK
jgi:tRNA modification GTPase